MKNGSERADGPALAPPTPAELDRLLIELEKRKLIALAGETVVLTRAGYAEIVREALERAVAR